MSSWRVLVGRWPSVITMTWLAVLGCVCLAVVQGLLGPCRAAEARPPGPQDAVSSLLSPHHCHEHES